MKTYVEVAVTIYKNVLVEVEHEEGLHQDEVVDKAIDAIDAPADSVFEVMDVFDKKPSKNNMALYDEFEEV
jgi:hypothetical protein